MAVLADGSVEHKVRMEPKTAARFLKLKARISASKDEEVYRRVFQIVDALAEDTDKGEKFFKRKTDGTMEEVHFFV